MFSSSLFSLTVAKIFNEKGVKLDLRASGDQKGSVVFNKYGAELTKHVFCYFLR